MTIDVVFKILRDIFGLTRVMIGWRIMWNFKRNVRKASYYASALIPEFFVSTRFKSLITDTCRLRRV